MPEIEECSDPSCHNQAQMAIEAVRNKRERLVAKIDFDNRKAPARATRYCAKHGRETLGSLIVTLLPPDQPMSRVQGRLADLCPTCHAALRSTNFGICPDHWHSLRNGPDLISERAACANCLGEILSAQGGENGYSSASRIWLHVSSGGTYCHRKGYETPGRNDSAEPLAEIAPVTQPKLKHLFEAGEGSSGMVCTRMVQLSDGTGDACGAPPAAHR